VAFCFETNHACLDLFLKLKMTHAFLFWEERNSSKKGVSHEKVVFYRFGKPDTRDVFERSIVKVEYVNEESSSEKFVPEI
jgi:hypothetical protein